MSVLKIVIEEYVSPFKKGKNGGRSPKRLETIFLMDPIPWKWELYDGPNLLTYGYVHTEDDANKMANKAINQYRPSRA